MSATRTSKSNKDRTVTLAQLRKVARAQPFQPFTICLADGRTFYVPHPECLLITPQASRTFIVAETGEDYTIVDLLLVTSIDFRSSKARRRRTNSSRKST